VMAANMPHDDSSFELLSHNIEVSSLRDVSKRIGK